VTASSPGRTSGAALDRLCINTIRFLAADAVEQAKSGHPGLPMGMADAAYVLWTRFLRWQPQDPDWAGRDRFVLSAGHGSMLLYALLHLSGYDLPMEELKRFRQLGSRTPGHPEHGVTPGVETTTGPLGQGFGNGVGFAVAARMLAARFHEDGFAPFAQRVFGIVSDGDLMEGVASESASLAGHWGLGNLIYLYDDNHITIEGNTALAFSEDVGRRFEAYGWHTEHVSPYDVDDLLRALEPDRVPQPHRVRGAKEAGHRRGARRTARRGRACGREACARLAGESVVPGAGWRARALRSTRRRAQARVRRVARARACVAGGECGA